MVNKLGSAYSQAVGNKLGVRPAFALPSKFAFYVDSSGNLCTIDEVETQITDVLGNLISIPADQIKDGVKIATGSYTGTGTYGASNPNSLTFEFEPKFIFISSLKGSEYMQSMKGNTGFLFNNNESSDASNVITWGKNSVSWYTDGTASSSVKPSKQLNWSGVTYNYIAIG